MGVNLEFTFTLNRKPDSIRIRTRRHNPIKLQLAPVAVVDQVYSGIDIFNSDLCVFAPLR
jgi:hypothetical protein